MERYYRPETLYAAAHFESYLAEREVIDKVLCTTSKWHTPEAEEQSRKERERLRKKLDAVGA